MPQPLRRAKRKNEVVIWIVTQSCARCAPPGYHISTLQDFGFGASGLCGRRTRDADRHGDWLA
jgi:hypothetical protein